MKPLIIYHGQCPDGFGAAYAAWCKYGDDAEYRPAEHGSYPSCAELAVAGRDVYILDFSFPRPQLEEMLALAKSVTVLDHHHSAMMDLTGFPGAIFDMEKSGARLAWEYFCPGRAIPALLACIEDRDLWTWAIPETKDVLAFVDTKPFDFKVWHELARATPAEWRKYTEFGMEIRGFVDKLVQLTALGAEPVCLCGIRGHKVNIGVAGPMISSEVGDHLYSQNGTFAMLWRVDKRKLKVSLRGAKGTDVSKIAKQFGGGGHIPAAAFVLSLDEPAGRDFFAEYILESGSD